MIKFIKRINKNNVLYSYNRIVLSSFKYFARDRSRKHRISIMTTASGTSIVLFDDIIEKKLSAAKIDKKITKGILENKKKFFDALFNNNLRMEWMIAK